MIKCANSSNKSDIEVFVVKQGVQIDIDYEKIEWIEDRISEVLKIHQNADFIRDVLIKLLESESWYKSLSHDDKKELDFYYMT